MTAVYSKPPDFGRESKLIIGLEQNKFYIMSCGIKIGWKTRYVQKNRRVLNPKIHQDLLDQLIFGVHHKEQMGKIKKCSRMMLLT